MTISIRAVIISLRAETISLRAVTISLRAVTISLRAVTNSRPRCDRLSPRARQVGRSLATLLDWPYVRPQPRGLVLILSAWNYPLQLSLLPLSGAIAAGCCAVLKPSELAPATAALLADRLPRYLEASCFPVITGGVPESQRLLQMRFDHVFFTGSTAVGRMVAAAASQHLTPVTLELGGKR